MSQKEGRIALAIEAFQQGHFTSLKAACTSYDVPYSTVRDRVNGRVSRRDSRPSNMKLTQLEESMLIEWILSMENRGLPVRLDSIRQMANLLLQKRSKIGPHIPPVGKCWASNFVQRHDCLQTKYTRKYDYQRAKCEDPIILRAWFRLIQNIIAKYGILLEDIYNFDETGFQMGVIATANVITGSERAGRPVCIQPGNREWVTAIESICADGTSIPPMVIFEGKVHISNWYIETLPTDWVIGVSEKGWTNDELGLLWLTNVFEKHTKDRTKGVYRLLILDGHGSHSTPEFDMFCAEHSIITLCMPPHSSHLLQPLDVSCFAALKRSYGKQIENYMRAGLNHIDKPDFLAAYIIARRESITTDTIRNGFAGTGIAPYDPERVLSKLNTQLRTPTPPPTLATEQQQWVPETPHDIAELELQTQVFKDYIKRRTHTPPSPTYIVLDQLVKGCQMAMHNAVLLSEENRQLRTENARQKKKKTKRRAYIATGGILTGQEGIERSRIGDNAIVGGVTEVQSAPQKRAPNKCSMCKSLEHTARTCLSNR